MEVISGNYHEGNERQEASIDQAVELARKFGHSILVLPVDPEYYEPSPEGAEMPSLYFASGAFLGGWELEESLRTGRLEAYLARTAA